MCGVCVEIIFEANQKNCSQASHSTKGSETDTHTTNKTKSSLHHDVCKTVKITVVFFSFP